MARVASAVDTAPARTSELTVVLADMSFSLFDLASPGQAKAHGSFASHAADVTGRAITIRGDGSNRRTKVRLERD